VYRNVIGNDRSEAGVGQHVLDRDARMFADDTELWAKVIKEANVTLD
jgi:hypothetical protein